jgi:hypothetical protein
MDSLKFGVLLSGVAGLVGCFLPFAPAGQSLWDLHVEQMFVTLLVLGGFALAILVAVIAIARPPILRWQALLAMVGFVVTLGEIRGALGQLFKGEIGGKLAASAPIAGILFSILAIAFAAPAVQRR